MAEKNFFLVNRSLLIHWLWEDKPFSKGQAWIDLIAMANYIDKKTEHRGKIIVCRRGDVNVSMLRLAERWGWSRGKTERFLKLLESDGMVKVNATRNRTTITIENYEKYQGCLETGEVLSEKGADKKQTMEEQEQDTKKEEKEREKKKDNIEKYSYPAWGEFGNVLLSEEELEKLKVRFPYDWQERIEHLSAYMRSRGKRYKSHYATILSWARNEEKSTQKGEDFLEL